MQLTTVGVILITVQARFHRWLRHPPRSLYIHGNRVTASVQSESSSGTRTASAMARSPAPYSRYFESMVCGINFASPMLKCSMVHKPGLSPSPSPARPEPSPRAGLFISTSPSPQSRAQARAFRPSRALHITNWARCTPLYGGALLIPESVVSAR